MSILIIILAALAGVFLPALVGLLGSRRRIGFGWAFVISIVTSPLIGLIVTLCTPKLEGRQRKWGCFSAIIGIVVIALILVLVFTLMPEWFEQVQSWFQA